MKKIAFIMAIVVLLSFSGCQSSDITSSEFSGIPLDENCKNVEFSSIDKKLMVIPSDSENMFCLSEDGTYNKRIFTDFYIFNPLRSTPIIEMSENKWLLLYKIEPSYYLTENKTIVDNEGKILADKNKKEFSDAPDYHTKRNPVNLCIKYNEFSKSIVATQQFPYNAWSEIAAIKHSFFTISTEATEKYEFLDSDTVAIMDIDENYLDGENSLGVERALNCGWLKEKYTNVLADCSLNYLYYEEVEKDLSPKIYRRNIGAEYSKDKNIILYKKDACNPIVSSDDSIFAYNSCKNASYNSENKWHTVVEKNGKVIIEFDNQRIVLIDEFDNELYVIDPNSFSLEIYSYDALKQVGKAKLDNNLIFPQIIKGKLQYTCPVYKNEKVEKYIVKQEQ
ncbi:MAG: hypothetical protein E7480_04365 [Ruminococcaceae bacterium]|nr:hypothetical protein [Oscillospiraceae bacterium]